MEFRILKLIILIVAALGAVIFISTTYRRSSDGGINLPPFEKSPEGGEPKISTSTLNLRIFQKTSTTTENITQMIVAKPKSISSVLPPIKSKTAEIITVKEVSPKSFEELINSSVIQLYCGNLNSDESVFSDISRGTGVIIDASGRVLTNRHVIYDENSSKVKNNCFILKSSFPNTGSLKPKIYYSSQIISYPLIEKFSDIFSKDKYYNDFALLKITTKSETNSKINLLLGFDYAMPEDYLILKNGPDTYNYLPIDWNYQPKNDDFLITLGYGVDSSHLANKITSTIGKIAGNINIDKGEEPQIILIESNATTGFSGGALINPKSKGLVGLVSWITTGDATGKYTAVIFRDFLRSMMIQYLNFDLKLIPNN